MSEKLRAGIYFDNAATTPLFDELKERAFLDAVPDGNPSSVHGVGLQARRALEEARDTIRESLGAARGDVIFTSGGTEANRLALLGAVRAKREAIAAEPDRSWNVVVGNVEHPSVSMVSDFAEAFGFEMRWAPNDGQGRIRLDEFADLVDRDTLIVSIQTVNNELGTIQPLQELITAARARKRGLLFHTDAVQGYLRVPLNPEALGVDFVTVSAHKIHGPTGVGALWARDARRLATPYAGGSQEGGLRPGTQNVMGIVGFAKAVELYQQAGPSAIARMGAIRELLRTGLEQRLDGLTVNGGDAVAPHVLSVTFTGIRAEMLLHELDARDIQVSAGSACRAGTTGPSATLQAIGHREGDGTATLRMSFGLLSREEEVRRVLAAFDAILPGLREVST
jgi:cysteine desulfurase